MNTLEGCLRCWWTIIPFNSRDKLESRFKSLIHILERFTRVWEIVKSGLKEHFQIIQKLAKGIGEIPVAKVVDFQPLIEVRRELGLR